MADEDHSTRQITKVDSAPCSNAWCQWHHEVLPARDESPKVRLLRWLHQTQKNTPLLWRVYINRLVEPRGMSES
ncbi:hypothetical protein PN4B1_49240 [Paenibacillus naphthalenovorans]|nr:hypothetical protein PN4B1_49240 [Paenibacillus naphthalenovorans]